jgi:hypothetical protein
VLLVFFIGVKTVRTPGSVFRAVPRRLALTRRRFDEGHERNQGSVRLLILLLGPVGWGVAFGVTAGAEVQVDLSEMTLRGEAHVTQVSGPRQVAAQERCPVTWLVQHR